MIRVVEYIGRRAVAFVDHALFEWLRDRRVPIVERMRFAPRMAFFVMHFGDLNRNVLPYLPGGDELQAHLEEDGSHYRMYLDDLRTLGHNVESVLSGAWDDSLSRVRRGCFMLEEALRQKSRERVLVAVETVEVLGSVAFRVFKDAAEEYWHEEGPVLRYFGHEHLELESGHVVGESGSLLLGLGEPDLEEVERLKRLVDSVWFSFHEILSGSLIPREKRKQ